MKPITLSTLGPLLALCFAVGGIGNAAAADPAYAVVDHWPVGGEGGWDYLAVDGGRQHLFVTRGDAVQVLDTKSGKLLTTISGLQGTHGIAFADQFGFISNGKSNAVTVLDLNTLKVVDTVAISGNGPDAILYEPTQQQVFAINHRSGNATVLDANIHKVINTIDLFPSPEFAATDGRGHVYINGEDSNELAMIDAAKPGVVTRWKLGSCVHPTGLAMDVQHQRLFSTCGNNKMAVLNSESGAIVAEMVIGSRPDAAAYDSNTGMIYSSNGDGTLTIIHEDDPGHFHIVDNLSTQLGSRTMALDMQNHRVYLAAAMFGPLPAASADSPRRRPPMVPGSFSIIVVAEKP